jgi:hypothetical protein
MAPQSDNNVPTVSHVGNNRIVELVYDAVAGKTAFAVADDKTLSIMPTVKLQDGTTLVPYAASNNLIRHRCVMLPSAIADHGGKTTLLSDLRSYLHRYVDLSEGFEDIAAHYILLSWVFDAFGEIP